MHNNTFVAVFLFVAGFGAGLTTCSIVGLSTRARSECAQAGIPSVSLMMPDKPKDEDAEWDKQHDKLAGRDPNPPIWIPWSARVDIQLGSSKDRLEWLERMNEFSSIKLDGAVKRIHDLELVERSCRKAP